MADFMAGRRWVIAVLLAFLLSGWGCAQPKEDLGHLAGSWIGVDIAVLVARWGPPQEVLDIEDGKKVYTWSTTRSSTQPPSHVPSTFGGVTTHQGKTVRSTTTQSFWVDANGRIFR